MEPKIVAYHTVIMESPEDFDGAINKRVREGWELYGNPYSVHEGRCDGVGGELDGFMCQAMVRRERVEIMGQEIPRATLQQAAEGFQKMREAAK